MLVPRGALGVRDNAGSRHRGAGEADGDVRVAGDDLMVAVTWMAVVPFSGHGSAAGVESGEDSPNTLREHVHVGKKPSFHDLHVEIAVKEDSVFRFIRHCWIRFAERKGKV